MKAKTVSDKIIFGLKVRQLRMQKGLSFAALNKATKMSVSYLNEIEKGKKYPKEDKIEVLAVALGVSTEELTSRAFDKELGPVTQLLQSNFLNELPLDLFGIELQKIAEIIANSPSQVGAFISTLLDISRIYALKEEHFFFGALRSYLEMHYNYFPEIEEQVEECRTQYDLKNKSQLTSKRLEVVLQDEYNISVDESRLVNYPDLSDIRSIYVPAQQVILLNKNLGEIQRSFQLGKELAFTYLDLKERAMTSSLLDVDSFQKVLNHSKAIYFSVALRMPLDAIVKDIGALAKQTKWQDAFMINLLEKYDVTPEILYHRLTNILPQFFGVKQLFFLRFVPLPEEGRYEIDKELHLHHTHPPHSNGLSEHYCRRWEAITTLEKLEQQETPKRIVRIQKNKFHKTGETYLSITCASPQSDELRMNSSVTLSMLIDDHLLKTLHFANDENIPTQEVNRTCEYCSIDDCAQRVASPIKVEKRKREKEIARQVNLIVNEK